MTRPRVYSGRKVAACSIGSHSSCYRIRGGGWHLAIRGNCSGQKQPFSQSSEHESNSCSSRQGLGYVRQKSWHLLVHLASTAKSGVYIGRKAAPCSTGSFSSCYYIKERKVAPCGTVAKAAQNNPSASSLSMKETVAYYIKVWGISGKKGGTLQSG